MSFLRSFVINLEHDHTRRAHMQAQLEALGMQAEFVPAVNGRALCAADYALYDRQKALRIYGVEMMDTEIGCYLSHYRLYERMVREAIPVALIMEDDIEISPAFPAIINELIADPAPPWLAVRFESLRGRVREAKRTKFKGECVKPLHNAGLYRLHTHVLGFGAYLIRREGAEHMLRYGQRIFMPIDQTMDRYWENGITPYIVRPLPVHQRQDFESRIGARPPSRHVGQPLRVQIARRAQRLSDGLHKRLHALCKRG
ncbi:MAG: glycosyltransferase family 25 protein [Acetobacter papayae]